MCTLVKMSLQLTDLVGLINGAALRKVQIILEY